MPELSSKNVQEVEDCYSKSKKKAYILQRRFEAYSRL